MERSGRKIHPLDRLTARERDVIKFLLAGMSDEEIADALELGRRTIKGYLQNIGEKLHTEGRIRIALMAHQLYPELCPTCLLTDALHCN